MKFASFLYEGQTLLVPEKLSSKEVIVDSPVASISQIPYWDTPPVTPSFTYSKQIQRYLSGKQLLLEELPFSINTIYEHYLNGYITFVKPINQLNERFYCTRCGNDKANLFASFLCARCDRECMYCRNCIMMKRISQCTPLVEWVGPEMLFGNEDYKMEWNGKLSKGQKTAADLFVKCIGSREKLLIWAVCGAGKTEVLFEGISEALSKGQSICLAAPRTDVVIELAPRIKKAFPMVEVVSLHGGSEELQERGQIVISTTHQLLRFNNHFDLMIVDEVDAFPYSIDDSLKFAVLKAGKNDATVAYLSATPDKDLRNKADVGEITSVRIPARYHGLPLPVPAFRWCGNWRKHLKRGAIPEQVNNWLTEQIAKNSQVFLFVPSVNLLESVFDSVKLKLQNVETVHAEDPGRHEKVKRFREGKTCVLITTTILERGITVSNVSVGVLGAEDNIFTESALVQISGRAGRSADYPTGDVVFFHYGKTSSMIGAENHIQSMNEEAKRKGWIS
ncbi:DEAD/DEAH box helicase [Pseudalkalibacillus caeni]|uniref:DNA/RNA helicase n=1 Tax=Exobacillus caeni TaxID=2574798 RepID=A0A5R9FA31_9BACL|nr:DEAD/DEAH box helicase [Pseudalkalibacillus caeni]TLS38508.1 DNA/RNA helicase [Pseudalkalibacillus caeni]